MFQAPWIEITTCFPCPNMCSYCPQDKWINAYNGEKILTLDNFKKALSNIPKHVALNFAGFAEPFVNQDCTEMMLYAHREGYQVNVWTTLVGLKDPKPLEDIPFGWFHVHDIGQPKKDYPFITEWVKAIPNDRGGNLDSLEHRDREVKGCSKSDTYEINVMMPNGDVYLCCSDWSLDNKLGNIFIDKYQDLKRKDRYEICRKCVYAT